VQKLEYAAVERRDVDDTCQSPQLGEDGVRSAGLDPDVFSVALVREKDGSAQRRPPISSGGPEAKCGA
jgi:hypothetical protein